MTAINIIFDGPPGPVCGRFVEVETDDGRSINAGEWIDRGDGMWALRITELPAEGETEFVAALGADVTIPLESSSPPGSVAQAMEARRFYDERRSGGIADA